MSTEFGRLLAFLCGVLFACGAAAEPVTLTAADGVKVYGEAWRAPGEKAPVILAFHQAESNHSEYSTIAPRLVAAGFTVLAIDQRSGGDYFGGTNKTVAGLGRSTRYEGALPDMAAALQWGKETANGAPVLLWGSSYSAALVFLIAARNPGWASGILAFSPGEYLQQRRAVRSAAEKVTIPVFVTQGREHGELDVARNVLRSVAGEEKVHFVPTKGAAHGSSTLRDDVNPDGAEENWQAVLKFLSQFKAPGGTQASALR
jgi:dienelactone hydrolase